MSRLILLLWIDAFCLLGLNVIKRVVVLCMLSYCFYRLRCLTPRALHQMNFPVWDIKVDLNQGKLLLQVAECSGAAHSWRLSHTGSVLQEIQQSKQYFHPPELDPSIRPSQCALSH